LRLRGALLCSLLLHGALLLAVWLLVPGSPAPPTRHALVVRLTPPFEDAPPDTTAVEELPTFEVVEPVVRPDAVVLPPDEPPPPEPPREDDPALDDPPPAEDVAPPLPTPPLEAFAKRERPSPVPAPPAPAAERAAPPPSLPRPPLRALRAPPPPYPHSTVSPGTTVELWLEYTIAADGTVTDAHATRSSGFPALDASVADFVQRNWRYEPPGSVRRVVRRFLFRPPS
jgi:protein TonB